MLREISIPDIDLGEHRFGRVNRRMPIGPVQWPFHDLFWIHEGRARLEFPGQGATVELVAPAGILILPETPFRGATIGAFATASICHFQLRPYLGGSGYLLPDPAEALHLQSMLRLALDLAQRNRADEMDRRKRLLLALLDGFAPASAEALVADGDRLAAAWTQASANLHRMRTLTDVAALLGITESTLRAKHRELFHTSAGEYLRELRLRRAEELMLDTHKSLDEIATAVGYRHATTLSAAFRARRGKTPRQYRRFSNPFA